MNGTWRCILRPAILRASASFLSESAHRRAVSIGRCIIRVSTRGLCRLIRLLLTHVAVHQRLAARSGSFERASERDEDIEREKIESVRICTFSLYFLSPLHDIEFQRRCPLITCIYVHARITVEMFYILRLFFLY